MAKKDGKFNSSRHTCPLALRRGGFSLVEILVVIAILGILMAMVFKGGSWVINGAKVRDTNALMARLDQAANTFESEKPYARVPYYADRYRNFPSDEIGIFSGTSSHWPHNIHAVAASSTVLAGVPMDEMSRVSAPATGLPGQRAVEAFILTIRQASPSAAVILDGVEQRFRRVDEAVTFTPPGGVPQKVEYYVDAWGQPLDYYATAAIPAGQSPTDSEWVAMKLTIAANGRCLFASYGPNGEDQLGAGAPVTTLQADYGPSSGGDHRIDDPFNADNLYSVEGVFERIR